MEINTNTKRMPLIVDFEQEMYEDENVVKRWLEEQKSVKDLFKHYSYDEMNELMNNWLDNVPSEDDEPSESVDTNQTPEKMFDDLFTS